MNFKKIVIAGGGILGSQIAFQTAYSGFDVTVLIRKEDSVEDLENKLKNLYNTYKSVIEDMANNKMESWANGISLVDDFDKKKCLERINSARDSIIIETDQEKALKDADLVIESITENIKIKSDFYKTIAPMLDEKTIVVTNSSTLLPSKLAKHTGRVDRFLSLHFANSIWKNNISEIMAQKYTSKKSMDEVIKFAEEIHMIPLVAKEEKSGYILNSMLVPFLLSAMDLLANGVTDHETIDKAWTLGTGAPKGPFQIIDTVGLITAKNIVLQYQKVPNIIDPLLKKMLLPYNYDGMLKILNDYIDKGKIGKSVGEGFYKYK